MSKRQLMLTRTLMEEFKPNFTDKIENEYRGLTVPSTSLAFSDNQDSEAGKNWWLFCLHSATQKRNLSTNTLVEEFKFACLENWALESKRINYRSQTAVQKYSKFNSKILVELTSCHILLWWKSPWQLWREIIFSTGRKQNQYHPLSFL